MTRAERIAALEAALAAGVVQVRYSDGRSVTYASMADLRAELERLRAEDAAAAGRRIKAGVIRFRG